MWFFGRAAKSFRNVAHKWPETNPLSITDVRRNILRETRTACQTMPLSLFGGPAGNNSSFKRQGPDGNEKIHVYSLKADQIRALPKIQFAATNCPFNGPPMKDA